MKIIIKYILTNVKERKARTAVMLMSILLSTTLLFVSFSISASYESAQRKMAQGMAGSATISVTVTDDTNAIDISAVPDLPSIGASIGMLEESSLYHENGYYETVDLIAADLSQLNQINKPRLSDGGEITDFSGNKIILPDRFTSKYGIEKGDTITLQIKGSPVSFEVAEIAAYDTVFLRHTRGATALLPLSALTELLGQTDGYSEILVKPAKDISTGDLLNELTAALPVSGYQVSRIVNEAQITADARQKSMPFFLISFFSLTISIFIIYSSYKVITLDRLPVIGTFRSIGATQKAVTRILLLESLLYGGMGGLIGIPAGMFVLKLILQGMGQSLSQGIEIPVVISPFSIMISFAVAIAVSLLSAWLPVRRASRLPIKDVVLGTVEEKRIPRRFIVGIGIILFLISVFLPKIVSGTMLYLAGGFSLLGLIAATILVIPLMTNMISMGLEHLYGLILNNEGRLAARNMRDNKSIAQNITLLFISISAVIAISVVHLNGTDISHFKDEKMSRIRRQNIGFVFQFYNLIPNLNVEENIMIPLLLDGKRMRDYKKQLNHILEVVGLSDRRRHTPRELSGGQQQRVAIARALVGNPEILFADEPTGNLDSKTGLEIMHLLRDINRESGQTIIMVTHSPEAAKSSSRIITVRDGVIE